MTYPDPNYSDPTTRNGTNVSEAPVSVRGDDGGDKLGNAESDDQGDRRTLHKEESVRASDEDQGLGNDRNLKVGDHVEHTIVGEWDTWFTLEVDAKCILEERSLQNDNDKDDGGQGEVQAISDGESEDLGEIQTIRSH